MTDLEKVLVRRLEALEDRIDELEAGQRTLRNDCTDLESGMRWVEDDLRDLRLTVGEKD
jgi:hypothetical protein